MTRLIPLLAIAIAVAVLFMYVKPTYSGSVATTKAAILSDDQALAAAEAYAEKENQLLSARDAIAPENLTRLEQFLPSSVNNVQMILDLNALAARSGVVIKDVGVATPPEVSTGQIGEIDLTLSATATYAQFRTFLESVERSARVLDVGALAVTGSETGVYTYTLTLRLYWLHS